MTVKIGDVAKDSYDLSVKNPNTPEEAPLRQPEEIIKEMAALDTQSTKILDGIKGML